MFCIALVLLLQCLFGSSGYSFTAGGSDFVQLDLFDSLHLHNSTYKGISLGSGAHRLTPGVIFTGDYREMMMRGDWVDKIRSTLAEIGANEFTISANVKQNPNNVGTLLAFSRDLFSALEIQSSGRKNELRVISGSTVETFPFRLADGSWHRLAISFSASQVDILVDCSLTYRRVLKFDPTTAIFDTRNLSIWIGQKTNSHFLYQGIMQDLQLTFGPYGYLSQCPLVDSQCPTCREFTALKMSYASLESQIRALTERLMRAEARLTNVEECECQKSCRVNETSLFSDGYTWHQNCEICTCKRGIVECVKEPCPEPTCKNPEPSPGECCPTCLKQCFFRGRIYDHGESEPMKECVDCYCKDGSMKCDRRDPDKCPPLSCPPSEQIVVPGECCKVCPGTDFCSSEGRKCHANATCVNLQTMFACQCRAGFSGDGLKSCEDIDECGSDRNHCAEHTRCVNEDGGYRCECEKGFRAFNAFQCVDADECGEGGHECDPAARCENTQGSYACICGAGYSGNGLKCSPICNRSCENGGLCVGPNVCSCRAGWTGPYCETDVDECGEDPPADSSGPLCPPDAFCVNKPGWYLCQCRDGFVAKTVESGQAQCQDIDECEKAPCGPELQCFNTHGSYECHCRKGSSGECSSGCIEDGIIHALGSNWFSQECHICNCTSPGVVSCVVVEGEGSCPHLCPSDSANSVEEDAGRRCCASCGQNSSTSAKSVQNKTCRHQKYPQLIYESGEKWYYDCKLCECLDGEVDCWTYECPPLDCHNPQVLEGECCAHCPHDGSSDNCHWHRNSSSSECHIIDNHITVESGARVILPHNNCISCKCQVPLCAKLVSKNDGFCVLRMGISAALMTMTALVDLTLLS